MLNNAADSRASRDAMIFDMDGTLVDVRSIVHFVAGPGRRDFHSFHSESVDCPPHPSVRDLLLQQQALGVKIIIVTARSERYAFRTSLWLREHGIEPHETIMRSANDNRPDHEVKADFAHLLAERYNVLAAVDDRDSIIEVWQAHGFPTIKVSESGELGPLTPPEIVR